jgi:hypothetical protein
MSAVTPTLPFSDPELFQQAAKAAESQYSAWIRATLRQVAVGAIQKSLTVNHDLNQLILSQAAWIQVESFCEKVASRWCEKLEQIGHKAVAARIREIVSQERASLFAPNTSSSAAASATAAGETSAASSLEQPSTSVPAAESTSAPLLPNNSDSQTTATTCITAYSRLRQLGQRNVLANNASQQPLLSTDKASNYLRRAGYLNLTEWPYDWQLIEDAVAQVPSRLHNRTTGDANVTLIPKSVWEQQQGQDHGQQQESIAQEATQWLLNRKRKSAGRERLKPRRRQIDESASTTTARHERRIKDQEVPRSASIDDGTAQWTIQEIKSSFSRTEREQLDSYLHDDPNEDDNESGPAPAILLGALSDVGRLHRWKQKAVDQYGNKNNGDGDDDSNNKYTEKKRRRLQNDAVKERLGDHQEETSDFLAGRRQRVSRVMRTCTSLTKGVGSNHNAIASNSCFDFDMSDSWLEWIDPGTGDRTLYAFSSLEVMVLDQDDNDGNDDNDEEDQTDTENGG